MIVTHLSVADIPDVLALEKVSFPPRERWGELSWASELKQDARLGLAMRSVESGELLAVAIFGAVDETAELLRVMVSPSSRRHGLARRLLMVGLDWASANGASRMLLEVRNDNEPAQLLYRELGFEPLAVRRDYYGSGHDAVVMELPMEQSAWAGGMA